MATPATVPEAQDVVRDSAKVVIRGGGTKPALSRAEGTLLDLTGFAGIVDYVPGEFTITARGGTLLSDVSAALSDHGQYMPFDPPCAAAGATLAGAVAAGLNGPGRYRYGGIRDFILGVAFIDGLGQLVHGGGKVVKNAAGFDIPKLMVGSLGTLGVIVELTFKVFPKPEACLTIQHSFATMVAAVAALTRIMASQADVDAFEIQPADGSVEVWVRLRGIGQALPGRAQRVVALLGGGSVVDGDAVPGGALEGRAGRTGADGLIVKIPLTPARIVEIEGVIADFMPDSSRRYSGGNQLWLAAASTPPGLDNMLFELGLQGLIVGGRADTIRLGVRPGEAFERRIKRSLDPHDKFPAY